MSKSAPKGEGLKALPKAVGWERSMMVLRGRAAYLDQRNRDGLLSGYRKQELFHLLSVINLVDFLVPAALALEWDLSKLAASQPELARLHRPLLVALVKARIVSADQGPVDVGLV